MHPKQPSWTVSLAVKNLWQISIGARFPCRSSTGPRANVNRSPAIVAMLPPRLLPVAVIGIYCGNVHSLKPGKQHKPCVFRISLPQMALRNLKKGLQTAQRFAQISGLVPDTVQPVRVGGLTPWGPRMTYLYSSLFELEDACDLPECELRHSAGKNWIGVYMIQHKMEQQLWDGLCILCISIYFRFFQYVLYLPWHEKNPTYPNHQPPLEGPHRRCQFHRSSTGDNSTASALLPDAPGMPNGWPVGHSTHRETDAQPIKVGDVPTFPSVFRQPQLFQPNLPKGFQLMEMFG